MIERQTHRVLIMASATAAAEAMTPLMAAYRHRGYEVAVRFVAEALPADLHRAADRCDTLLVVGNGRRSPRRVLPGPAIVTEGGRSVPVGWVPNWPGVGIETFAHRAAAVHERAGGRRTIAILGQRTPRYRDLSHRIERTLATETVRWTADELGAGGLTDGLAYGLGAAIYVGHGRPSGWVGYRGFRRGQLPQDPDTIGGVLSLTCNTASRHRIGLSFSESLVLSGVAASVLAATGPTNHLGNARWALRIAAALATGGDCIGDVVLASNPDDEHARRYRIIGDPLAPLNDAPRARARAHALTNRFSLAPEMETA